MLISHKYKFITIDIPKTGTKTLRQTLLPVIPIDVIGKGDNPNDYFYQHCNVNACERGFKKRGWDFNSYKKFSTLRNPWKRYVSFLMYKINKGNKYKNATETELAEWNQLEKIQGKKCSEAFDRHGRNEVDFLKFIIKQNPSQDTFVLNKNGEIAIDILGDLDNFDSHFLNFREKVGLPNIPSLKHSNKSSYKKPHTEYYNQELIDMVAEKEKWIINNFNYKFEK